MSNVIKKFGDYLFENNKGKEQEETDVDVLENEQENNILVIYNDDVNSFDHVIDSLVDICKHTREQANQIAMLVHYKGKCEAKEGDFDTLLPMKRALNKRGITANIE